jgi:RimJ/RimL family protein N-acetyltransferase
VLETDRLVLRPWRPQDRDPFALMNADARVMEHFPAMLTRAESDALADRIERALAADGYGLWAVEVRGRDSFAGFVGLAPVGFDAHFTPAVEVGWRLVAHAWGHGYASEAAREALRFGFGEAGLREIVSFTVAANVRSVAVMARIGLHRDPADDFDHPRLPPGHPLRRQVLYRLRREEWEARRDVESTYAVAPADT